MTAKKPPKHGVAGLGHDQVRDFARLHAAPLAAALAKAQAELVNPEKSLTATIRGSWPGEGERSFRYAPSAAKMRSSHYPICLSERAAARELNKRQIPLATGARWHGVTVARLRQRS